MNIFVKFLPLVLLSVNFSYSADEDVDSSSIVRFDQRSLRRIIWQSDKDRLVQLLGNGLLRSNELLLLPWTSRQVLRPLIDEACIAAAVNNNLEGREIVEILVSAGAYLSHATLLLAADCSLTFPGKLLLNYRHRIHTDGAAACCNIELIEDLIKEHELAVEMDNRSAVALAKIRRKANKSCSFEPTLTVREMIDRHNQKFR